MRLARIAFMIVVSLTFAPWTVAVGFAGGQELPPGPTTAQPLSRLPLDSVVEDFAEAQLIMLDFAPGAWTPLHSHGGLTLVRVLEGELTRRAYGTDDVFLAGEGWAEAPGDIHAAGNASAAAARVLVTFLLPEGAPLTTVEGMASDDAPPGPVASFQSRRVSVGSFGEFDEVATTVLAFAPGAWTPRHSHAGLTLVGVLDEDMTVRGDDGETTYRPGDLWVEAPGNIHAAGNTASSDAHVAVTFLLRRGAAATTLEPAEAHTDSAGI